MLLCLFLRNVITPTWLQPIGAHINIFLFANLPEPFFPVHLVGQVISIPSDPRDPSNSHKNMFHTFVIIVPAYSGGTIRSMIRSFFVER